MSIDMFVDPDNDPRADPPTRADERSTLVAFLRWQRDTLELTCAGLDAADLARRSVQPSTLSLLGLVRHMAEVERRWFRRVMAPDPALVAQAWNMWRAEVAFAERFVAAAARSRHHRQDADPWRGAMSLRWVSAHRVEEYALHNGHADLLRQRIDGAVGQ